jgi:cell fate (sporulation/competence/biofilm development) regulator YlbF (YheA/YmcA/DUF963 family)
MSDKTWNELEVAPRSAVMQTARQFAETLGETAQFHEFEQAYFGFRQDTAAQDAIREFQKKQASLTALVMLNAVGEEDKRELEALQERFYKQPSVVRYNLAVETLAGMSQEIGDLLSQSIGLDFGAACKTGGCCG